MNGFEPSANRYETSAPTVRSGAVNVGRPRWRAAMACSQGAALVEAALVLPLLLLLILNVVNFGIYMFAWITVDNAARAAAEYSVYNGVAVQFPGQPTFTAIQSMTDTDVSSLPNYSSLTGATPNPTLRICSKFNTTAAACSGTCTAAGCVAAASLAADPAEPTVYTIWYADVAYTYTPVFSSFNIPALGISLTLPATTIHQQTAMRSTQ